jgi:two-component system LytT family response regulator
MQKYQAIIIDDEKRQQDLLKKKLQENFPEIEVCAICGSVDEGIMAVVKHEPQLVFLDIEMPEKDGFEFLKSFKTIHFSVIFTTSHSSYALEAFRVAALDFLLKPFSLDQLRESIERFKDNFRIKQKADLLENFRDNLEYQNLNEQKLALPSGQGFIFVRMDEIIRIESQAHLTTFFMVNKEQIIVSRTLKECEDIMPAKQFVRIHQSHMVNLFHVKKFNKGDGGTVIMSDGSSIEVSRRRKDDFIEAFQKL